jgi:hypothetical protein
MLPSGIALPRSTPWKRTDMHMTAPTRSVHRPRRCRRGRAGGSRSRTSVPSLKCWACSDIVDRAQCVRGSFRSHRRCRSACSPGALAWLPQPSARIMRRVQGQPGLTFMHNAARARPSSVARSAMTQSRSCCNERALIGVSSRSAAVVRARNIVMSAVLRQTSMSCSIRPAIAPVYPR